MIKKMTYIVSIIFLLIALVGCQNLTKKQAEDDREPIIEVEKEDLSHLIEEKGFFTSQDQVALYLYVYEKLPSNYRLKESFSEHVSNYWTIENKISVGGDYFYNRERLLPVKENRQYFEADINYKGAGSRGSERIVFSNDGLIFYTKDHYDSFIEYDVENLKWKLT